MRAHEGGGAQAKARAYLPWSIPPEEADFSERPQGSNVIHPQHPNASRTRLYFP